MYNYIYLIQIEPRTIHAWRQFDCLSFAQNFYNNTGSLFNPAINNLGTTGTGKSAGEFALIPFIVANIWKLTGMNSSVYKMINLLFLITGILYIYKLFLLEFKNKIIATLIVALMFTSPILSYYGVSTISDIPSFALCVIGFYFFYKYLKENDQASFLKFIILFVFAGVIKASSAFVFLLCGILFLINKFSIKQPTQFFKINFTKILLLCVPVIIWFAWYAYAYTYNTKNINTAFLLGAWPVWGFDARQISEIFDKFIFNILHDIFHPIGLFILFLIIFPLSLYKIKGSFNRTAILLCILLFFVFIILFYGAINVHDYYFLNPFALIVIAFFFALKEWHGILVKKNYKFFVTTLSILIVVFSYISGMRTWLKINDNVQNINNIIAFNTYERKNFFWIYWIDRENYKELESKDLNIENLGIKKNDPIFCLGDPTPNRALYLLNRRGYSNFNVAIEHTPQFLKIHPEIKYLVLIDTHLKKETILADLLSNKIFEKGSLSIYKVNKND